MSGFYLMHRGWMDNPALGGSREPYCRRAAWAWLIENAVWQDGKTDAGGKTVSLKRGQLCYSVRYLAEAWSWTPSAVQRFIERLKTDTMINTASDTGRLIITICNYEVYQAPKSKTDTPTDTVVDTVPIQTRYTSDTNKKEGNKGKKEEDVAKATSPPPSGGDKRSAEHPDFSDWYSQYPRKEDRKAAAKAYASARKGGATREGLMAAVMRYAAECGAKGTERQYIKHPTTWLNKGSWQNEPDLLTPNRGNQNVLQLDLSRTYQQQPDIRRRAILAAMPELGIPVDELDITRAGAF